MKRSEVHLDTAANKLTYIETRMDAAEGRLSDVIRHLYEAFQNFRISIGPQTWLDNQVADMYETFLGAQFRKFGKVEKMTWQVICSAAKSVSMVSLFYVRFEALVEMREISQMKKPDTSKLQKLDKTLADVDLSFKNWKLSVNWFDPLSEIDLRKRCVRLERCP